MTPFLPLLIFMLVRLIYITLETPAGANAGNKSLNVLKRRFKMSFRFNRKINNISMLFNGHYVDVKALYVLRFNTLPCISFIGETDPTKAYAYIKEMFDKDVKEIYQHSFFDHDQGETFFNNTIFIMANERMIEIGSNYCHLLHNTTDYGWARNTVQALAGFRIANAAASTATAQTRIIGFAKHTTMSNN
ncbi:hypothetical protein I5907_00810 [Panacibacter sp. DH6]|uniref:Uncharacterized protein n=1 Tax=Panacibacter microcysteis TaxID=2793269 RepID=A0A931DZQ0_9BACT|nr:hypothetical protein [Panacibacter microcysteis]MBG9374760.1 hypothetical protein [Panacibacter microcysteis]